MRRWKFLLYWFEHVALYTISDYHAIWHKDVQIFHLNKGGKYFDILINNYKWKFKTINKTLGWANKARHKTAQIMEDQEQEKT